MADLAKTKTVRDGAVALTLNNGAASQTITNDGHEERLALYIKNTDAVAARIVIKAGNGIRSVAGDLKIDVAQNEEKVIGYLEGMRFKNMADGKITVNITGTDDGAFGGSVANVKLALIQMP